MNEVDKEWKQICRKGDTENELFGDVNDCITKVFLIIMQNLKKNRSLYFDVLLYRVVVLH